MVPIQIGGHDDPRAPRGSVRMSAERLILVASLYWLLAFNRDLFGALLRELPADASSTWRLLAAVGVAVFAAHILIAALPTLRWLVKPWLAFLTLAGAAGTYYINRFGAVLDAPMLRSVLHTHASEARELLTLPFFVHLLIFGALPVLLLWRVQIVRRPWHRAWWPRLRLLMLAVLAFALALWSVFQPLSSLMRNRKELRYLMTPANVVWSTTSALAANVGDAAKPRTPLGLDAAPGPSWAARSKPLVVLMVVGETARAANWQLNGYARATTPELAQRSVVNFSNVTSCGTNTEVSLPCMFAPVGRRQYDETRIRGQESLLHVVARAGVGVRWRDNQSGCKGVCEGLPNDRVDAGNAPGLCDSQRCLDEGLVADLDKRLADARGTQLWVVHMLGNHGPSYWRRYPDAFARFKPDCRDDNLRTCSTDEIVAAYDNALLYTDHVLARAIDALQARASTVDSALLYVSDHGESLGEKGLFLHGMPYLVAPEVQTRVPMVWWQSAGFESAAGLAAGCAASTLRRKIDEPIAHDHLFHSLLGALDVRTSLYEPTYDLFAACRGATASIAAPMTATPTTATPSTAAPSTATAR